MITHSADDSLLMTLLGALGLVILLMLLLAWSAKRSGWLQRYQRSHPAINLVARLSLGARERLVLVDIGEQRLLLGVTAHQITCLSQSPQPQAKDER